MTKIIVATYTVQSEWDLQELFDNKYLSQHPDNMKDYYIKYDNLTVEYEDGSTDEVDGHASQFDYKYPDKVDIEEVAG